MQFEMLERKYFFSKIIFPHSFELHKLTVLISLITLQKYLSKINDREAKRNKNPSVNNFCLITTLTQKKKKTDNFTSLEPHHVCLAVHATPESCEG